MFSLASIPPQHTYLHIKFKKCSQIVVEVSSMTVVSNMTVCPTWRCPVCLLLAAHLLPPCVRSCVGLN